MRPWGHDLPSLDRTGCQTGLAARATMERKEPKERRMQEHELEAVIAAADDAINREDLDTLMDFYTDDATLVVTHGKVVTGKPQIRKAFDAIAAHFNHTVHVSQGEMIVFEGGDTALVLSNTHVRANQGT